GVRATTPKIHGGVHPEGEAASLHKMTTIIEIELDDGKVIKGQADFGKGSPVNPMTDDELAQKVRQCSEWGMMPKDRIATVLDMLWHIEELADVNELTKLLRT